MAPRDLPENISTIPQQDSGPNLVDVDVACPECEYNLRGLNGPIVECPECGLTSDVPAIAARQWDKPWYRAPGFNVLALPAVLMCVGWYISRYIEFTYGFNSTIGVVYLSVWFAGWCVTMYLAYRMLQGYLGVLFALLIHPVVIGYLVSIVGGVIMIIWAVIAVSDQDADTYTVLKWVLGFAVLLIVFWGCRRIERAIAMACVRHYMRRPPCD